MDQMGVTVELMDGSLAAFRVHIALRRNVKRYK